jgi:thioredoxin-related protein
MRIVFIWIVATLVAFGCVYEQKLEKIEESNRLLWVYVEMQNCPWCEKMHKEIIESGFYERRLGKTYALEILSKEEAKECGFDVQFFPTSILIDPSTNELLDEFGGYMRPADFLELLTIVYEQWGPHEKSL